MSTENICPHCGFKAHDDEICNACGKLIHDDLPQKSFRQIVREVGTELKEMGFQGDTHNAPDICFYCNSIGEISIVCSVCGGPV